MDHDTVRQVLAATPGTRIVEAAGDTFALYDPHGDLPPERQIPWATIVHSDAHDTASDLDRRGVYRLNLGLTRARFAELVDPEAEHDLTALDVVLPHPVYGGQHWVCVLVPDRTWPLVRELIGEAHAFAARKFDNRAIRKNEGG